MNEIGMFDDIAEEDPNDDASE
jgi:hypothetical protein